MRCPYDYVLPQKLIAQKPLEERGASRLLVLDRETGVITDTFFPMLAKYLRPGDCLVLNDTRCIPARIRKDSYEILLLRRIEGDTWHALVRPGKKLRTGVSISFGELECKITRLLDDGIREISFSYTGIFDELLAKYGETPLPPYIKEKSDPNAYQTVYAKHSGAVAAPTAGLHFTNEHLETLAGSGVNLAFITLHVGLGTFRPVKDLHTHKMHEEFYSIDQKNADIINSARQSGKRIIAVGTTSIRALESAAQDGLVLPFDGFTDIFIKPGYVFKITDALITNFHLPKSTLLMLVSAFAGTKNIEEAYKHAIDMEYRFYSFGDAMFIA